MEWNDKLISGVDAQVEFKKRSLPYSCQKINKKNKNSYLSNNPGYEIKKETKNLLYLVKEKKKDEILEDKVWCLFYKMGFERFNQGRRFEINWSNFDGESKQIDVFCSDEETALIVECKSGYVTGSLKENVESYRGIMPSLKKSIFEKLGRGMKIAFLYVTEDFNFSTVDENRLKTINDTLPAYHFDEKTLENYMQLVDQIGSAAKYQLLGLIFKGRTIKNLDNKVNAIEGKMGGLTYYSFVIKPSQLLKMAYVLHRNNANSTDEMMPAYQRIIKRDRLNKIRYFIENKSGFFPNAIIISIRTKNENDKTLEFNPAAGQDSGSLSRIGTVLLPKEYQSAYVIDGQHRLYGYSSTKYADKNSIPVIAFVNMKKEDQVQMFMDINQNQKAVPKVLRDTLEADLLYTSDSYSSVNTSIKKRIAIRLGEDKKSVLYNMVLTGENPSKKSVPLTISAITKALDRTIFFNDYNKTNSIIQRGCFDYGITFKDETTKLKTERLVFDIISESFKIIKKELPEKWDKENGFLITNNLVQGIICLISDFVSDKISKKELTDCYPQVEQVCKSISVFLEDLVLVLDNFTADDNETLRHNMGEGALTDSWHLLGSRIFKLDPSFNPEWMKEYLDKYCQENIDEANFLLQDILKKTRLVVRENLKKIKSVSWELMIPTKIANDLNARVYTETRTALSKGGSYSGDLLDVSSFSELHKIIHYQSNYSSFGKRIFANHNPELFSNYDNKADLLGVLDMLNNSVINKNSLSKTDFEDLTKYSNIFNGGTEN